MAECVCVFARGCNWKGTAMYTQTDEIVNLIVACVCACNVLCVYCSLVERLSHRGKASTYNSQLRSGTVFISPFLHNVCERVCVFEVDGSLSSLLIIDYML